MDKALMQQILSDIPGRTFSVEEVAGIEELLVQYPWFAAARFAHFATLYPHNSDSVVSLAPYKKDPLLFALFVQQCKPVQKSIPPSPEEDILALINELPNTNPIGEAREMKARSENLESALAPLEQEEKTVVLTEQPRSEEDKSLMVMMSFTDWLFHFKNKTEKEKQEEKEKKALKTSWQKEKLAALSEEEDEEIPEEIFKQAMDSISENTVISESLAIILAKQGKTEKAIDMYRKLSLRNPEKNLYFADRIKELLTLKDYT